MEECSLTDMTIKRNKLVFFIFMLHYIACISQFDPPTSRSIIQQWSIWTGHTLFPKRTLWYQNNKLGHTEAIIEKSNEYIHDDKHQFYATITLLLDCIFSKFIVPNFKNMKQKTVKHDDTM
jgi:hypothetical protein